MWKRLRVKYPLFCSCFNQIWILSTYFQRKLKYQVSSKPVQWEPSCSVLTERQIRHMDGRTDMTKLIAPFQRFKNAPRNINLWTQSLKFQNFKDSDCKICEFTHYSYAYIFMFLICIYAWWWPTIRAETCNTGICNKTAMSDGFTHDIIKTVIIC